MFYYWIERFILKVACLLITHFCVKNEIIKNPELKGVPLVVVARNKNDLIVIDRSSEARMIKVGTSYKSAISVCPSLRIIESDYGMYEDAHRQNMMVLNGISPCIESVELGNIMIDVTGLEKLYKGFDNLANILLSSVPNEFSPRLGIADNKFFSYIAALQCDPNECVESTNHFDFMHKITPNRLPIRPISKLKLQELGVNNLRQLSDWKIEMLQVQFGMNEGKKLWELSQGIDSDLFNRAVITQSLKRIIEADDCFSTKQSLMVAISYGLDELLSDPLFRNKSARSVILNFSTVDKYFWNKKINFKEPLFSKMKIVSIISNVLDTVTIMGPIDRIMIELTELTGDLGAQKSMFLSTKKKEDLLESIKQLETRLGSKVPIYNITEIDPCSKIPERRSVLTRILP